MKKKIVIGIVSVALVLCMIISGTIAYLTSKPDSIRNLFVMGADIDVTFEEGPDDGKDDEDNPGSGRRIFDIKPGVAVNKEAKITVAKGSAKTYVFVQFNLSENYSTYFDDIETYLDGYAAEDETWAKLTLEDTSLLVYYYAEGEVDASEDDVVLNVFDVINKDGKRGVTPKTTITSEDIKKLDPESEGYDAEKDELFIEIFVGCIQAEAEFEDGNEISDAWEALTGEAGTLIPEKEAEKKALNELLGDPIAESWNKASNVGASFSKKNSDTYYFNTINSDPLYNDDGAYELPSATELTKQLDGTWTATIGEPGYDAMVFDLKVDEEAGTFTVTATKYADAENVDGTPSVNTFYFPKMLSELIEVDGTMVGEGNAELTTDGSYFIIEGTCYIPCNALMTWDVVNGGWFYEDGSEGAGCEHTLVNFSTDGKLHVIYKSFDNLGELDMDIEDTFTFGE